MRNFYKHLFYRTPPDDFICYFHIKQPILLTTHITHTRIQKYRWQLKVYISTEVEFLKIDFLKTTGIAKDDIKVSVILVNKYEVKGKNFIIPISVYGN